MVFSVRHYIRTCQAYDATVESIGFDPIRVKYRRARRDLITEIIRHKLSDKNMNAKIQQICDNIIPIDEQDLFKHSVQEDLHELTINTISGLGISEVEFNQWKQKQR